MKGKSEKRTSLEPVILKAKPHPVEIDLQKAAIVIIDMQNAFLAKGAYSDLLGYDIRPARAAIGPIGRISRRARERGVKIIYLYIVHHPGDDGGGPNSVHWFKEASMKLHRAHPEFADKLPFPNKWGAKIVNELTPQKGDIVIEKPRYSGFFDTNIRTVLKRYDIKYLIITGVNSNCCVESTIRDAYHHGYFSILVSDATAAGGPPYIQKASLFNVKSFFGWVTNSENILKALE
jgi:ureidoacrylate peracid hydrolase